MQASVGESAHLVPSASVARAVATLLVHESDRDMQRVAIPRPEVHLVVRFGPSAHDGLDVHALGVRQTVHRKLILRGQRTVMSRIQLGAAEAVLGVPAPVVAGRTVALEDLWGRAPTRRLLARLADARTTVDAAAILERAIAERFAIADRARSRADIAVAAAGKLMDANVGAVATSLGVSERHLRRLFREAVGVSPKAFVKLARFHRALRAAQSEARANWASVAASAGYYDQAHLISEFRAIAGVTPRALLGELRAAPLVD